ncbi:MAG: tamA [Gammaproteobacteria bacterium]|jgi:translocation and assembly module TamA|nr:tamA [Gammaproteobacteria bacterium]
MIVQYLIRFVFLFFFCFLISNSLVFATELLHISISGITGDALKNVEDKLTVEQKLYGKELTLADIRNIYEHAPDNIQSALKPYGYFKAKISATLTHQATTWIAKFHIHPGPQLRITKLDLSATGPGKNNRIIQEFIHHFPLKNGDPLLTQAYEDAKTAFFQVVNNQGYIKAILIKKELRIDLASNTAIIILHMHTGPRYYFGSLSFGKSPFALSFLRRFQQFNSGEPFSNEKILTFQQNLTNSHYFREVIVTPEFHHTKNSAVPVYIQLIPHKAKQYKLGIGYGTFTGPRLLAGVNWRYIGDSGQHFTALAKFSSVLRGLAAKYFIPGSNPLTDQYTLSANIQEFRPQNGNSFSESISGAYIKMRGTWQHSLSLNLLNERYTFNNQPRRNSHELYPSYTVSRIITDNIIDPHSGRMISLTLQGSSEKLFSTTSFIQSEIKAKFIFSPTLPSRIILRGNLGYTVVNDINQLPLTLQYLAGGPGSVRGYNYGSIGPGRYLEVISAEYQHRIMNNVYGALFYDVGTATNKFNQGFQRGDGVGLVYSSPIGPIQIYLARAESKSWKPKSIIFNIGAEL